MFSTLITGEESDKVSWLISVFLTNLKAVCTLHLTQLVTTSPWFSFQYEFIFYKNLSFVTLCVKAAKPQTALLQSCFPQQSYIWSPPADLHKHIQIWVEEYSVPFIASSNSLRDGNLLCAFQRHCVMLSEAYFEQSGSKYNQPLCRMVNWMGVPAWGLLFQSAFTAFVCSLLE